MRIALIALLCVLTPIGWCGEEGKVPRPAAEPLLSADEAREVEAVINAVVGAGFPDAAKATVYSGKLTVNAIFDPGKDEPPLPSSASTTQMTMGNAGTMNYGYAFDGLHFKLADGSWLISLMYHFKPKKNDAVNTAEAKEVDLKQLTASAIAAMPYDAEKNGKKWIESVAEKQRARAKTTMERYIPVLTQLRLTPDGLVPAIVLLQRAGWADALGASLTLADQRSRSYWQLRQWTETALPFDPTNAYPKAKEEEEAWRKANPLYTAERPAVALRRGLFRWCRAQMQVTDKENAMLPLDVAAACTKAALDPKDPQGHGPRVDALLAGMKLPVTPAEKATLAEQLQSWELRPRQPKMVVTGGGGNKGNGTISMATGFEAPKMAYEPKKGDLDALMELLADERPSRMWDYSGARTVGDNAMRAVAVLVKSDPRKLAGLDVDKPWTSAERKAAAGAVQKWWKEHRKEYGEN